MMLDRLLNAITWGAWGIFLIYLALVFLRKFQQEGFSGALRGLISIPTMIGLVIVLAISFLSASLVFIEPQESAVIISITNRDGYRQQPLRSGLHWIVPLAERVITYPIYWQTYTMSGEALEGAKTGNDSISARTSDGQEVFIDSSVIYRIDPNELIRVHIDWQGRYVDDFIRPILRGVIRTEVSQFTADEVNSSKRKNLEANLDEQLRNELEEKGFVLDRFLLRKIAFSPEYASAIELKQVAEQDRIKRDYEAEQIRRLAEGFKDKLRIEAEGRAAATLLQGEAEAKVTLVKSEAEAEAIRRIAAALGNNQNLILYRYVDKLGQNMRVMVLPSNNPLLLPLPDINQDSTSLLSTLFPTMTITSTFPISSTLPFTTTVPATNLP
jgi:regulator of protease activity HflC (stomatin/prohibitin superfamily)